MKKLLCLVMTMAVFVATTFCFVQGTFASTPVGKKLGTSDVYYKVYSETKTLVISGTGDMPRMSYSTADIPWLDNTNIENVVVEEGVTSIGNYAFYQMNASVTLPSTIKTVGNYSFAYNPSLTSVEFGKDIIRIGNDAFEGCINLSSIKIEDANQTLYFGEKAFMNCPSLKTITVPLNASCGRLFFGYASAIEKEQGVSMRVYPSSKGHNYAEINDIPYTLIDGIEMKVGVKYSNSFDVSNVNKEMHYTFTPEITQSYCLYSQGPCDTKARLELAGKELATSNDVDTSNSGFCITYMLEKGKTYDLFVGAEKMTGDYELYTYPADLKGFTVIEGSVTKLASDYKYYDDKKVFDISNNDLAKFKFRLTFGDGSVYDVPYARFIAGKYVNVVSTKAEQSKKPFSCGKNVAVLELGGNRAGFLLEINHSFSQTVVKPTEDIAGYVLLKCVYCSQRYSTSFVESDAVTVKGVCYLSEHPIFDTHTNNIPYNHATITVGNRVYDINADGTWEIHTFTDCYAVFNNQYGENITLKIEVSKAKNGVYNYGDVALAGYDLNSDGIVNAKDYAIFRKEKQKELGSNYWDYAEEFMK